ncbi:MAG TPA: hypothetical protein VK444_06600 [Methanobacteriaceae archaeon]|nr:hypothetical protein [Methanobacteriaceae archaeon]
MVSDRNFRRSTHLLLAVLTVLVIISGLGIAYFRPIEALTLGLLDKTSSFKIHSLLFIPFLVVLILHTFMPWILKNFRDN